MSDCIFVSLSVLSCLFLEVTWVDMCLWHILVILTVLFYIEDLT